MGRESSALHRMEAHIKELQAEIVEKENAKLEAKLKDSIRREKARERVIESLQAENAKINREYIKVWEVLRTYNPSDIELKYIGFEDVK